MKAPEDTTPTCKEVSMATPKIPKIGLKGWIEQARSSFDI
jgi:hypothetical protein